MRLRVAPAPGCHELEGAARQRCLACKQVQTRVAVVGFPSGSGSCVCAGCAVRIVRAFFRGAAAMPDDEPAQLAVRMLRLALLEDKTL